MLINPRSGTRGFSASLLQEIEQAMGKSFELFYQFSHSVEDGSAKTCAAVEAGFDAVLVIGGDGMVNSIGSILVGTRTALGVIPAGSGNGFARHFGIPLDVRAAARCLAAATPRPMDVGFANDHAFFITCSFAYDAAIAEAFQKFPIRGILPYVLAGAGQLIEYRARPIRVVIDDEESKEYEDPLIFTVANLSQFGGGARIAPAAKSDDGWMELVTIRATDAASTIAHIGALFDGTMDRLPAVQTRRFQRLRVIRDHAAPLQVDGEVLDAPAMVEITMRPRALQVLQPDQNAPVAQG